MDYLVGIDLGSTNLKAIVYDATGRVAARASRPTQRFNPDPEPAAMGDLEAGTDLGRRGGIASRGGQSAG